jgi:phospholipid/cholesterol/gamma-HCH transport system permease protein
MSWSGEAMKNRGVENSIADVEVTAGQDARVILSGRLDAASVAANWARVVEPLRQGRAAATDIDASGVEYCDGAGVGLLIELRRIAARNGGQATIHGLPAKLAPLVEMASLDDPTVCALDPPPPAPVLVRVGRSASELLRDALQMITFTGEVIAALCWAIRHPRQVRWRDVRMVAEKAGVNALPVASLLGALVGAIVAYQTAAPLRNFGADADVYVADIIAVAVLRELGPLITAILAAGRTGSAFAAEVGTMKVTEELDALSTMGLSPVRFLIVPRVLATVLVLPFLCVFVNLISIAGGYAVFASLGYPWATFWRRTLEVVNYVDLLGGLFKMLVFALLVAAIGCQRGLVTKQGPGAVGDSTTRAVVTGIVLIIAADWLLGAAYFRLGI